MTERHRVVGARTSYYNTPESDKLPEVMHDVDVVLPGEGGVTVRLMAAAPDTAIDLVKSMQTSEVAALPRVIDEPEIGRKLRRP